jgi:oxygen-dependent protoporphyrinogen oxidase
VEGSPASPHPIASSSGARPRDVVLFEADRRLGGVIETERSGERLLESGPDSFVVDKPWALDLCRRIGLEDRLVPTNERFRRTLAVHRGRLAELPEAFQLMAPGRLGPFLRTPLLSWRGKARRSEGPRAAATDGRPPVATNPASFVRRRLGGGCSSASPSRWWAVPHADPEVLSLAATMPRFLEMERRNRSVVLSLMRQNRSAATAGTSGARFGLFLTLRGGIGGSSTLWPRVFPPGSARTSTAVTGLERGSDEDLRPPASPAVPRSASMPPWWRCPRHEPPPSWPARRPARRRLREIASTRRGAIVSLVYRSSDLRETRRRLRFVVSPHAKGAA